MNRSQLLQGIDNMRVVEVAVHGCDEAAVTCAT